MEAETLRRYERAIFGSIIVGPLLVAVGVIAAASPFDAYRSPAVVSAAVGVVVLAAGIGASFPIATFRTIVRKGARGPEFEQARYLGHLKASSILLNLLWVLGLVGLFLALLARGEFLHVRASHDLTIRLAAVGAVTMVATIAHAFYLSLRIPLTKDRPYPAPPFLMLSTAATLIFVALSVLLLSRSIRLSSSLVFDGSDAPLFLLTALVFTSLDVIIARPIPGILDVFRERGVSPSRDYVSRTKSVLLPAVMAFSLLFLILFLVIAVGFGTTGIRSPVQAVVFIFVGAAMLASIYVSIRLGRSEDVYELYRLREHPETRLGRAILWTSVGIASLFGVFAVALLRGAHLGPISPGRWVDVLSIGLLIGLGPYGFYVAARQRRTRNLEERFPDFLRDVAASHRGGLTLAAAVQIASKGEYGELTPEIRKMADQLSWNVPFNEALAQLMDRVQTPLVERTITLIIEASRSGGNTTDVLLAAARDAREIKNLENERRQTMGLYSIIIYITFFVFLVVAAVLYGQLVPQIIKSAESAGAAGAQAVGLNFDVPTRAEYRAFYFMAAIVQSVGNGLVGGLFQNGKILSGLRHAFVMVLISYVTFTFVFP